MTGIAKTSAIYFCCGADKATMRDEEFMLFMFPPSLPYFTNGGRHVLVYSRTLITTALFSDYYIIIYIYLFVVLFSFLRYLI